MVLRYCRTFFLGIFIAAVQVHGQPPGTEGFISIDCGATVNSTDSSTGIPYTTDDGFIETGTNYKVLSNSSLPKQYSTVRSFPIGDRNCYTLPANNGFKYLVRASFMYGNYDGKDSVQTNSPLLFDLYIGVEHWNTVKISNRFTPFTYEVVTFLADPIHTGLVVCLIRTNSSSIPFISLLETRPLKENLHPLSGVGVIYILLMRRNLGASADKIVRYPDDLYDRIWEPFNITTDVLTTAKKVERNETDGFDVPPVVFQTASVSAGVKENITFNCDADCSGHYVVFHFSELELLSGEDGREFNVYVDNQLQFANVMPTYLKPMSEYWNINSGFILNAIGNATRPPLLSAFEIHQRVLTISGRTHQPDVDAMFEIKDAYKLKNSWAGDPCLPVNYTWDGVNCSVTDNHLRVTAINLSSSGLVGEISTFFPSLTEIQILDLSYNNLSGKIPDFFISLANLKVLNLTGNCITEIPKSLIEKSTDGSLILRVDNNNGTCNSSTATKKRLTTPIIIVLSVVPTILLIVMVVLIIWRIRRKTRDGRGGQLPYGIHQYSVDHRNNQLPLESHRFTYMELENITKKFSRTLGKGGFGTVFHGSLEDGTEIAVKMCSLSSEQAPNLFLAEVENLSRARHKNLVSLVGYCTDRGVMAVVYEYMALGSLEDHLRGKAGTDRCLSWAQRLQIVIDAAQGLDYLYNGCPMPIIHRDIKSSNILLAQNLAAKISDFGLAKAFHSNLQTHVSMTALAFTPGYADPMCLRSWRFNEKTDVYSFGVVLLEIITGEPPIRAQDDQHVIERVQLSFEAGDINAIIDPNLQGIHNNESVWKAMELAMRCTAREFDQRPKMAEVVIQLKEILERETAERSTTTESQIVPFMQLIS